MILKINNIFSLNIVNVNMFNNINLDIIIYIGKF